MEETAEVRTTEATAVEAKGFASPSRAGALEGSDCMTGRLECLVGRVQVRMRANGSARTADAATPREIAELQTRIHRLHALGDCFSHVTLSSDVTQECVAAVRTRVGGEFVATEV